MTVPSPGAALREPLKDAIKEAMREIEAEDRSGGDGGRNWRLIGALVLLGGGAMAYAARRRGGTPVEERGQERTADAEGSEDIGAPAGRGGIASVDDSDAAETSTEERGDEASSHEDEESHDEESTNPGGAGP